MSLQKLSRSLPLFISFVCPFNTRRHTSNSLVNWWFGNACVNYNTHTHTHTDTSSYKKSFAECELALLGFGRLFRTSNFFRVPVFSPRCCCCCCCCYRKDIFGVFIPALRLRAANVNRHFSLFKKSIVAFPQMFCLLNVMGGRRKEWTIESTQNFVHFHHYYYYCYCY